jgi:hypothetical protein
MPMKSMSMEITYLSKMYYHSKFQGTVLSGGYASVTTVLFFFCGWHAGFVLNSWETHAMIYSHALFVAVWPQGSMLYSPSLSLYMPQKSRFVMMYVSCLTVCLCVFWCAHVLVVFRQLHRWQLYARNCALRRKRCNKSLFLILKKGVKKDKRREEVASSMKRRKQQWISAVCAAIYIIYFHDLFSTFIFIAAVSFPMNIN